MPKPIIIDCDPGHDDAIALILALASPELDVRAITTVAGNQTLDKTLHNALRILTLLGRHDIPVAAGAAKPLQRALEIAAQVHGESGLDGPQLPEPAFCAASEGALALMARVLEQSAEPITLVPTGPLTNIATAFARAPDIVSRVQQIVLMGGAYFEVGNITPAAEFNIYVDPEAADIVFKSGVPIVVMPLDVTHKALTTRARIEAFRNLGTEPGRMVAEWTDFFERFDMQKYGSEGAPLHDPCVIAYLIRPDLFTGRHINVEVETQSELTLGMTVADWWGVTSRPANALFIGDLDAEGFYALLTERIARL